MKKFIKVNTTPLYEGDTGVKVVAHLLWGDSVRIDDAEVAINGRIKARARGRNGFVKWDDLNDESLLEVYFIDVGQGDGILIKTPSNEHIMVDGGYKRTAQQSGKNAADFVDWKFFRDYGMNTIELDAMISSHNDSDHYGGLWDLINPKEEKELSIKTANVKVKKYYHAGVAWLKDAAGKRGLGPVINNKLTLLVNDKNHIKRLLTVGENGYFLQGEWAKFMQCLIDKDIDCERLSNVKGEINQFTKPDFAIKVLSPLELEHNTKPAYEDLGIDSINTNGHSVTLRVDYKSMKMMLTGDLNSASQKRILAFYETQNNIQALACDVSKACHHGSDDCSFEFLTNLAPGATVISSGDAEGHSHPRPSIVSASALTGHKLIKDDKIITPLVYSTEISRSYKLGQPINLLIKPEGKVLTKETEIDVTYKETNAGDLNPATKTKTFWDKKIVGGIIYGLVNVRTNGNKILCATLSEKDDTWDIKEFQSRF
jgi:beta-lactamase superfamily II metal-dependent hydrolase